MCTQDYKANAKVFYCAVINSVSFIRRVTIKKFNL